MLTRRRLRPVSAGLMFGIVWAGVFDLGDSAGETAAIAGALALLGWAIAELFERRSPHRPDDDPSPGG